MKLKRWLGLQLKAIIFTFVCFLPSAASAVDVLVPANIERLSADLNRITYNVPNLTRSSTYRIQVPFQPGSSSFFGRKVCEMGKRILAKTSTLFVQVALTVAVIIMIFGMP
ncbi:MAG: hypothetical protein ACPGVN_09265, partial [Alphaproteobacteria bacterium]